MIVLLSILIFFCSGFFLILILILIYGESECKKFSKYILILGAKIIDENTPCKTLEKRLLCAVKYLKDFQESKVIVSGGKGIDEPVPEAYTMKKFLIRNGVEENRILIEDMSTNTFENMKNTKRILKYVDKIIIVTSKYHYLNFSLIKVY